MERNLPYGITQCLYLPPDTNERLSVHCLTPVR